MANLKEIRIRIKSVNSTMQITSAMKMVSAAKLRRAQDAITQMRPYANKLREILVNLSSSLDQSDGGQFSEERDVKKVLLVPITSNRGLCGAFNANVVKQTRRLIKEEYADANVSILAIGKKGDDFFKKNEEYNSGLTFENHPNTLYDNLDFEHVAPVAEAIMEAFVAKQFDKVVIVYNGFKNAAVQLLSTEQFLPVVPPKSDEADNKMATDYIFEPSQEQIVRDLIPKSLKTQLYKAMLDSHAAEHGARMTAMHKATDNASELLKDLRLTYNKARQAAITNEILEIVGGAEALKG